MPDRIVRHILEYPAPIPPFNEPARELTINTQPLKIHQEELITHFLEQEQKIKCALGTPLASRDDLRLVQDAAVVYADNLWFDEEFLVYFMRRALSAGRACRAAFRLDDKAFRTYTLPLTTSFEFARDTDGHNICLLDLWYFPKGYTSDIAPVIVPSDAKEKGFFSVPDFMTMEQGDLTHFLPMRSVMMIESWVHIYFATVIFSNFARASRLDERIATHNFYALKMIWRAMLERKQILSSTEAVRVGKGTVIHPTAVITGPAEIGENCAIGPGVFIDNCTIGDNVTIDDGCVLMMSTLGNNCFLPFRASLYMTAVMESTIIAQNTCLQMCVIGRNSFVGAGSTFTDFNLVAQKPIRATTVHSELEDVGQIVLGSAVGHNCRVGSGMVVYPGRMIESDTVLVATPERRVLMRNVTFEESDHHHIRGGKVHRRFYPRPGRTGAVEHESW